ncbi:TrmH family RNA methyltransferase [Robertkochia sediminum]|uniref:TrmH family RNA methyltransferase n=1 Tax=Robertkochia sediminum TaxID=2785326 RepID=UPI001932154E|nr:RNA methyltransferase [Robertkochia sediminum]MBL7473154.1 RNA methyltransferase [Robertkochia sediminum]
MSRELLQYLEGFITPERKQRFEEILKYRTRYFTVAIEDIFQVHNTSAVIRSCDIFGIQDAHVIEERYGKRLDKNIAMGAQKWVDVHRYETTDACIAKLREEGYRIVATTPHEPTCDLFDLDIETPSAFFFGTERDGLSETVLSQADERLRIPMYGFTESLNISVSAAIILQHITTRLRASDIPWALSEEEQFDKRLDWTRKSVRSVDEILSRFPGSI